MAPEDQESLGMRTVVAEMRKLRTSVVALAEQADKFVARDEMEVILTEREFRRRQYVLTAVAVMALLLPIMWGFYQIVDEVRQGTRCMVEQMVEHRFAARAYDREIAKNHGIAVDEKDLPPLPDLHPTRLDACKGYENGR